MIDTMILTSARSYESEVKIVLCLPLHVNQTTSVDYERNDLVWLVEQS